MSSLRISLRSVLRLRPVFEEAGEPGIFSVPDEPGEKLGVFLNPRAYMAPSDWNFFKSQGLYKGGEIGIDMFHDFSLAYSPPKKKKLVFRDPHLTPLMKSHSRKCPGDLEKFQTSPQVLGLGRLSSFYIGPGT